MVSVGNLSVGGTGKTPVVALLARWLVEAGERPAILSRGYARREPDAGVVVVSDGTHLLADLDRSGDEPLMLARDVPGARVLVCEDRALAGALAERALDATIHLLDDGFQHLLLARDLDIVVVSPRDLDDRVLPIGRLREPVGALASADAVIFEGELPDPEGASWFTLRRSLAAPRPLEPNRLWEAAGRRVVAAAGIARPERFARLLEASGWEVAELVPFADHHRYIRRDVERLAAASARHGAPILTTAKDAVRLLPLRPLPAAMAYAPLRVSVEPEERFRAWFFESAFRRTVPGPAEAGRHIWQSK